jgi:hydrogenase nickel incorporation protein HypB
MPYRLVEVQQNILRKNDELASRLRNRFIASGTFVFNFLSSPGAGKTTLLEDTLRRLGADYRAAALVGDQATDADAVRLARSGVPVRQITTGAECRLDASMIEHALSGWLPERVDVLAIENVGNLICPAEYDLGEDLRAVLFSVTEGEDKPLKYPLAFNTSHVVLITKTDIAEAANFDSVRARANIESVNPGVRIIELSAKTGAGLGEWIDLLRTEIEKKRTAPLAGTL